METHSIIGLVFFALAIASAIAIIRRNRRRFVEDYYDRLPLTLLDSPLTVYVVPTGYRMGYPILNIMANGATMGDAARALYYDPQFITAMGRARETHDVR